MPERNKTSSSWKAVGWVVLSIAAISATNAFQSVQSARHTRQTVVARPTVAEPTTSDLPGTVMHSDILNLEVIGAYPVTSEDNARLMTTGGQGAVAALDLTCIGQSEIYLLPEDRESFKMLTDAMSRAGYDRIPLLSNPTGAVYMTTQPRKVALATVPNGLFVCEYVGG